MCKCIVILHMTPSLCVTLFVNQPVTRCNFFWVKFDPYSNYSVSAQNLKISNTFQQKMNIWICLITNIRLCVHVIVRMFVTYVPYVSLFTFPLSLLSFFSRWPHNMEILRAKQCVCMCVWYGCLSEAWGSRSLSRTVTLLRWGWKSSLWGRPLTAGP